MNSFFFFFVCDLSFFKQGGVFFSFFIIPLILKILKSHAVGKRIGWFEVLSKCQLDKQSKSPFQLVSSVITAKEKMKTLFEYLYLNGGG